MHIFMLLYAIWLTNDRSKEFQTSDIYSYNEIAGTGLINVCSNFA